MNFVFVLQVISPANSKQEALVKVGKEKCSFWYQHILLKGFLKAQNSEENLVLHIFGPYTRVQIEDAFAGFQITIVPILS